MLKFNFTILLGNHLSLIACECNNKKTKQYDESNERGDPSIVVAK